MPRHTTDTQRIYVRITREQYELLREAAARRGSDMSEVVRRAVEAFLRREEGK